jgi:hypothetical protein
MPARIGLKVLKQFQTGGIVFIPGKFVPEEAYNRWDQQALSNRLNNFYVKWEPIPEDAEEEKVADLDALDKGGLLEYAAQRFPGITFDKRQNVDNLRSQVKAMKERADLLANGKAAAQAARSGESAAKVGGGSSSASSAKPATPKAKPETPPAPPAPVTDPVVTDPAAGTDQSGAAGGASGESADQQGAAAGGTQTGTNETGTGSGSPAT